MKTFEYWVKPVNPADFADLLRSAGLAGWELIQTIIKQIPKTVHTLQGNVPSFELSYDCVFKREVEKLNKE